MAMALILIAFSSSNNTSTFEFHSHSITYNNNNNNNLQNDGVAKLVQDHCQHPLQRPWLPTILRVDSLFFPSTEVLQSTFTGSALRSARIVCHPSLQPRKRGMHGCYAVVLLHQRCGGLSAFSLNPQGLRETVLWWVNQIHKLRPLTFSSIADDNVAEDMFGKLDRIGGLSKCDFVHSRRSPSSLSLINQQGNHIQSVK